MPNGPQYPRGWCLPCVILLLLLAAPPCLAFDASSFRLSTFGTLSLSHVEPDDLLPRYGYDYPENYEGRTTWKTHSLLGLQIDNQLSSTVSATVQLILKERAENSLSHSVEWAFLRWTPANDLAIRLGRLSPDYYMLADYRDISFAYLWHHLPTEFYGSALVHNFNGLDISYTFRLINGNLTARLFGGNSKPQLAASEDATMTLDMKYLYGASLNFENDSWRLFAGFSRVKNNSELDSTAPLLAALNDPTVNSLWPQSASLSHKALFNESHLAFYSLGISYDHNNWLIQGEVGHLHFGWKPLASTYNAYLSVARRFASYTPYIVFAMIEPSGNTQTVTPPPSGYGLEPLYNRTYALFHSYNSDHKTISLGLRKNIHTNLALKVQWDHTWIEDDGSGLYFVETDERPVPNSTVDVFSLSLSWVFGL
jgi:hypothetical protein